MESIIKRYKESYVAFLDVLGFKNMVTNSNDIKLTTYFNEVNTVIEELKKIDRKKNIGYIVISDSIILTIEKDTDLNKNTSILRQLCIAVGKIQKKLALNDIWLRGAISSGKTFYDQANNQIVGPAYISAYQLEEELAIYPRVILDNRIINDLNFESSDEFIKEINNNGSNEEEYIALYDWNKNESVTNRNIEQDVLFFIDYLHDIINNSSELEDIYKNIKSNIYSSTRISKKFRWVTNYLYTILSREGNKNSPETLEFKEKLKKI